MRYPMDGGPRRQWWTSTLRLASGRRLAGVAAAAIALVGTSACASGQTDEVVTEQGDVTVTGGHNELSAADCISSFYLHL